MNNIKEELKKIGINSPNPLGTTLASPLDTVSPNPLDTISPNPLDTISPNSFGTLNEVSKILSETTRLYDNIFILSNPDGDLVIKVYEFYSENKKKCFENEVKVYKIIKDTNISPKYYGNIKTPKYGLIFLELMDGCLVDYNKPLEDNLINLLSEKINKLHNLEICHGDLCLPNIIYKEENNVLKDVFLIDYELCLFSGNYDFSYYKERETKFVNKLK